jgi:hypothetical protein
MRGRALVVGLNEYRNCDRLNFAESDAQAIAHRLEFHGDAESTRNFAVETMLGSQTAVTRSTLRGAIGNLFSDSNDLDLVFYFSGHGHVSDTAGYLVTSDAEKNDYGITMQDLVNQAMASKAKSVLLLLDCCHAGSAGDAIALQGGGPLTLLRDNMTILAASLAMQSALESSRDGGLFTAALKDALDGAAADILGEITTASVYAVVEKRFSLWQQRPVAKSYVTRPIVLRKMPGRLTRLELRKIIELFPSADHKYQMDPDHDPERDLNEMAKTPEVPAKVAIGRLFKRYRDAGLLRATNPDEHLYYVAQRSHTVELTLFGREYWRLAMRRVV